MFKTLYDKILVYSKHRHATKYLCVLSFAESIFFPVPPDVMLIPMALAQPKKAYRFAMLTTIFSVVGGMLGYGIGFFLFDYITPWLQINFWEKYLLATQWFAKWGMWAIFVAGFSPIPYKIFTITAGVLQMFFLPFVLASIVGRGMRFFLLALLLTVCGEELRFKLHQYINFLGWGVVMLVLIVGLIYKYKEIAQL